MVCHVKILTRMVIMALVFGLLSATAGSKSCNATFTYNGPTDGSYQYTVTNPEDDNDFSVVALDMWSAGKWHNEWTIIGLNSKSYTFEISKDHFYEGGHYHRFRASETDGTVEGAWYINKDNPGEFYKNENPWTLPLSDGGVVIPVNKFDLLAAYVGVSSTVLVATAVTAICAKRVKRRDEKQ